MSLATDAITGRFVADAAHSSYGFEVRHMKVSLFRSSFSDANALVVIDEQGARCEGTIRVDSIGITKPQEFRDAVVYGTDFFDAKHHPEMSFRSESIELGADGTAKVGGFLTLKGITKAFSATGTYHPPVQDPFGLLRAGVEMTATVDRRDWGMNWQAPLPMGGDALGYEVRLNVHLELVKESE